MSGEVQHFEVPFDDESRATHFYKSIFGWQLHPMPEMQYTIVRTTEVDEQYMPKKAGAINGGMYKRKDASEKPLIVITVDHLDETINRVREMGGEVEMEKVQVGDMGWYAKIKDTEGNIVGVWENIKK